MFYGLVETKGTIAQCSLHEGAMHFTVKTPVAFSDLFLGASVAINGVCLTVTRFTEYDFDVTAVPETLRLTNLGHLTSGQSVNLERAAKMDARNGGHCVQGHVDTVGEIVAYDADGDAVMATITVSPDIAQYIVKKGYIALDGMSITIVDCGVDWFKVTFIPQTRQATIVSHYGVGTKVNIEVDILGKYIEKLLGASQCNPI